jgi:hypothetical protein
MGIAGRLNIAVVLPMLLVGGITAAPAQADPGDYIDQLEANGLLVYAKPPECAPPPPGPPTDPICPRRDKFFSQEEAYTWGRIICNAIQRYGSREDAIESLTIGQHKTFTRDSASAIYDIAVTNLCWQ